MKSLPLRSARVKLTLSSMAPQKYIPLNRNNTPCVYKAHVRQVVPFVRVFVFFPAPLPIAFNTACTSTGHRELPGLVSRPVTPSPDTG